MGRSSKLTPQVQETIIEAIMKGASYQDACESVGIWFTTFNEWVKKGEEATSGKYHEFNEAVRKANAQVAVNFAAVVKDAAASGDAKIALEWLKRRRRGEWGDGVDVTSGGEKIEIEVIYVKTEKTD